MAKGRVIGLREAGAGRKDILERVKKRDGSSPSIKAVDNILERFKKEPKWDGLEGREAGGRTRDLTSQQEAKIVKILLRDVGKHVVSATHVKRTSPELRHVPDRTIQRTFSRLGFAYLYRRGKAAIGDKYKPARIKYSKWLLKQDQRFLNGFCKWQLFKSPLAASFEV